jgi:hypothetical protein
MSLMLLIVPFLQGKTEVSIMSPFWQCSGPLLLAAATVPRVRTYILKFPPTKNLRAMLAVLKVVCWGERGNSGFQAGEEKNIDCWCRKNSSRTGGKRKGGKAEAFHYYLQSESAVLC